MLYCADCHIENIYRMLRCDLKNTHPSICTQAKLQQALPVQVHGFVSAFKC
jgi:hypothetical protein